MASAKDTRRTSVIAELQDTLEQQKQQLELLQLRQSQKQPLKEEDESDDDSDSDNDENDKKTKDKKGNDKGKGDDKLQQRVVALESQLSRVTEWLTSLSTAGPHDVIGQVLLYTSVTRALLIQYLTRSLLTIY